MKSLFDKFFKKEPQFNYTIADYQPIKTNRVRADVSTTEFPVDLAADIDDMDIDKIYQNS
jgi:hypothetical protein